MKNKIVMTSLSAPFHAREIAKKYNQDYFQAPVLEDLVNRKRIRRDMDLFIVGAYLRNSNHYRAINTYNKLSNYFRKTVITFAGSDILQIIRSSKTERMNILKYLNRKDVCVAAVGENLAVEVEQNLGILPRILYMPINHEISKIYPMPKEFTVGCYMPAVGSDFYGYTAIVNAALRMPDVKFKFYTLGEYKLSKKELGYSNIDFLKKPIKSGQMNNFLKDISCGIRVTEHDGNPMSLAEYNIAGRWFAYNQKMPYCFHIKNNNPSSIINAINKMRKQDELNYRGAKFYLNRHDKAAFIKNLRRMLS